MRIQWKLIFYLFLTYLHRAAPTSPSLLFLRNGIKFIFYQTVRRDNAVSHFPTKWMPGLRSWKQARRKVKPTLSPDQVLEPHHGRIPVHWRYVMRTVWTDTFLPSWFIGTAICCHRMLGLVTHQGFAQSVPATEIAFFLVMADKSQLMPRSDFGCWPLTEWIICHWSWRTFSMHCGLLHCEAMWFCQVVTSSSLLQNVGSHLQDRTRSQPSWPQNDLEYLFDIWTINNAQSQLRVFCDHLACKIQVLQRKHIFQNGCTKPPPRYANVLTKGLKQNRLTRHFLRMKICTFESLALAVKCV